MRSGRVISRSCDKPQPIQFLGFMGPSRGLPSCSADEERGVVVALLGIQTSIAAEKTQLSGLAAGAILIFCGEQVMLNGVWTSLIQEYVRRILSSQRCGG